jgi:hypothetical protein
MTKSSIDFVATSQINQSHNIYPAHINTGVIVSGTGNVNNGQNLTSMLPNLNLNLQSVQQTTQSRLQQGSHLLSSQIGPITYDELMNAQMIQQTTYLSPQKQQQFNNYLYQQTVATQSQLRQQLQQQQLQQQTLILTSQANMIPLGSMPNPITIDDNTMDVRPTVINTLVPSVIQVQNKSSNLNRQSLSPNTKK